jgi:uncharacterized protein YvpB
MKLLKVPYKSQWDSDAKGTNNDCGPTSLAMVINYFGGNVTTDRVFLETKAGQGYITFTQLRDAAKSLGYTLSGSAYKSINEIKELIDKQLPAIVVLHYGDIKERQDTFTGPHILVVVGYDDKGVYVNDPNFWGARRNEGYQKYIPLDEFLKGWNSTVDGNRPGNLYFVAPPSDWEKEQELPLAKQQIDFYDFEGKRHTVEWYVHEWKVEKQNNGKLAKEIGKKNDEIAKLNKIIANLRIVPIKVPEPIEEVKPVESKKYSLNKEDLSSIGRGLGIALIGTLLTFITDLIPNVDLGTWTPIVVAFWSVVANTVRKFLAEK